MVPDEVWHNKIKPLIDKRNAILEEHENVEYAFCLPEVKSIDAMIDAIELVYYQSPLEVKPLKYRFTVVWQSKEMKMASDFLEKCDLGIGKVCIKDTMEFTYSKTEQPIEYFKDLIKQAMELCGSILVNIEGGKVE